MTQERQISNTDSFNYRAGTEDDLEQIKALTIKAYGPYKSVFTQENWLQIESNFNDDSFYKKLFRIAECILCEKNSAVLGVVFLVPSGNPQIIFQANWSYIRLLGVNPDYMGMGIGKKLVQMCIDFAKDSGETTVALHTAEFQKPAYKIYESLGFTKDKEFKHMGMNYWLYILEINKLKEVIEYYKATIDNSALLAKCRLRFTLELTGEQPKERVLQLSKQLKNYFLKTTKDQTCISYIARIGDEIAGIGSLLYRETPGNFKNPTGKRGYIINMYTIPQHRKKGICSEILKLLIEEGKKKGITAFELNATEAGEPVYLKSGFKIHQEPTLRKII